MQLTILSHCADYYQLKSSHYLQFIHEWKLDKPIDPNHWMSKHKMSKTNRSTRVANKIIHPNSPQNQVSHDTMTNGKKV